MNNVLLYFSLAIKDVVRLWPATQIQIVIISGICLPILLLLGLKNGHVAELRNELVTSPTGRQIIFWSARGGDLLSNDVLIDIEKTVPNTELVIPESQRLVFGIPSHSANAEGTDGQATESDRVPVTLYSTLPGDPLLRQHGIEVVNTDEREVVLSKSAAAGLGVVVGDSFEIEISRKMGAEKESHRLPFLLKGVVSTG